FLDQTPPTSAGGGDVTVPRTERIAFTLTIPLGYDGTEALPLAVYGPGTGGSTQSPLTDGVAQGLPARGMGTFVTEPVMHHARAHSDNIDPNLISTLELYDSLSGGNSKQTLISTVESGDLFFNPLNLQAAKGNSQQAAVDYAWQAHWLGS